MVVLVVTCGLIDAGSTDDAIDRCLHMLVATLSNDYRSINSAADSNMDKCYQAGMHASQSKHALVADNLNSHH